jgi:ligand-binding sensor domain-containing protein
LQSSQFRRLTGVIVTVLVVLLVILIGSTLARFPLSPAEGVTSAAGEATATALATAGLQPTFTPTPGGAEAVTTPEAPASDGAAEVGLGVTLEATPTRRDPVTPASSGAETDAPPSEPVVAPTLAPAATRDPSLLPLPDPSAPPTATVEFFANPNDVQDVAFAGDDLWAATHAGALQWDVETETGTLAGLADGLGSVRLTSAVECPLEQFGLVFGSDNGLQVYSPASGAWQQITSGGASIRHSDVSALACDATQGLLAVGYAEHGFDLFRARQGRWYYVERSDEVAPQGVTALAIGNGGVVWVASRGALASVNGTRISAYGSGSSPLTGEEITALVTDDNGALWVTAGDRLYRFADATWEVYGADRVAGDFPGGLLADVQAAPGGRVWVAGAAGEICRLDPELDSCSPFYSGVEGMAPGPLRDLAVGSSGALGYGTAQAGSSLLLRSRWRSLALTAPFPAANRTFATAADSNGFLWVAGSAGVQQVDPGNPASARTIDSGEDGTTPSVRTLYADGRGGVWLGGLWASYFDGATWSHFTQADGLAGDEVTAIAEDAQGRIWFGTPVGLSIWTGTTFFNLNGANGLPDAEILSLAADARGMWIGAATGGLYRFEDNKLQVLTAENVGLPSNTITALLAGADGVLYVGTDAGLAQFSDGAVTPVEDLPALRVTSLASSPDGTVWVGTLGGGAWVKRDGVWAPVRVDGVTLPADVRSVTVDLYGGAWLGSDRGLVRVSPRAR